MREETVVEVALVDEPYILNSTAVGIEIEVKVLLNKVKMVKWVTR